MYVQVDNGVAHEVINRMQMIIPRHEAQTTSACSERIRGNLGEVLVFQKAFKEHPLFKSVFRLVCLNLV